MSPHKSVTYLLDRSARQGIDFLPSNVYREAARICFVLCREAARRSADCLDLNAGAEARIIADGSNLHCFVKALSGLTVKIDNKMRVAWVIWTGVYISRRDRVVTGQWLCEVASDGKGTEHSCRDTDACDRLGTRLHSCHPSIESRTGPILMSNAAHHARAFRTSRAWACYASECMTSRSPSTNPTATALDFLSLDASAPSARYFVIIILAAANAASQSSPTAIRGISNKSSPVEKMSFTAHSSFSSSNSAHPASWTANESSCSYRLKTNAVTSAGKAPRRTRSSQASKPGYTTPLGLLRITQR